MDKKVIEERKAEAQKEFEVLKKQAGDLEEQARILAVEHERKSKEIHQTHQQIIAEMTKLQGEWRAYDKLNGAVKDELAKARVKAGLPKKKG